MLIRTHKIKVHTRFEGEPLDKWEQQELANRLATYIAQYVRSEDREFCDLGLHQDIDIIVGGP